LFTLRRANDDTILSIHPMTVFIELLLVVREMPAACGGVACSLSDDPSVPRDVPGRWFGGWATVGGSAGG
jgi:hypothetical protein